MTVNHFHTFGKSSQVTDKMSYFLYIHFLGLINIFLLILPNSTYLVEYYNLIPIIMIKIIHVYLIFERKNYYFGSITAIFDNPEEGLTEARIGIKKSTLLHAGLKEGCPIPTERAIITESHLIRGSKKNK